MFHHARVTDSELLEKIDAAIDAILTGHQAHSVLGRSYAKADLADLWQMRKEVVSRLASTANGGGARVRLVVPA